MILRLDELAPHAQLTTDICIVGAGVAGLAIASELFEADCDVVVVESGPDADELNAGQVVAPFNGLGGRRRGLGGTTQVWPGQVLPLSPRDLVPRDWVEDSGWPLGWEDLALWYPPACELFGLPWEKLTDDAFDVLGHERPAFDDTLVATTHSVFLQRPRLAETLEPRLRRSRNVRVLLGGTAVRLEGAESGRTVEHAELRSLGGRTATIAARQFVLCCGGIENPRLLLVSGLGNDHDTVGRYFHDHVWSSAGVVSTSSVRSLRAVFDVFARDGLRYNPKLVLAPPAQETERVLACSANLVYEARLDSGAEAALRLYRAIRARSAVRGGFRDAVLMARDPVDVAARIAARRGWRGPHESDPERIDLLVVAEQAPTRESRVTLGDGADPFGVPLPLVDWRIGELERRTLVTAVKTLGGELERLGLATVEPAPELEDPDAWREHAFDSFHHCGATRMSSDPRTGVVDTNCCVHGIENLFVAGSSVFPTSGYANPTLTIAALALRLGARLRSSLA
jgi:choline dehydrogenase-like flavoprotein